MYVKIMIIAMPQEDNKILKYDHGEKSMEVQLFMLT